MCKLYLQLEKLQYIPFYACIHIMCICYLFTTVTSLPCIMHPMRNQKKDSEYTNCLFESHTLDNYPLFGLEMPASILFPSPSPSTSATIQPNLFSDISRHCNQKETRSLIRFRTGQICGTIYKYVRVHMRINKYRER